MITLVRLVYVCQDVREMGLKQKVFRRVEALHTKRHQRNANSQKAATYLALLLVESLVIALLCYFGINAVKDDWPASFQSMTKEGIC